MKISKSKTSSKAAAKKVAPAKAVKVTAKNPEIKKAAPKKAAPAATKKPAAVGKKPPIKPSGGASRISKKAGNEMDDDLKEFMRDDEDVQPLKKSRKDDLADDDDFKMEDDFKIEDDLTETFSDDDDDDF
jgi:hypothetical protein